MIALDVELDRLLHERAYRREFRAGAPELGALDRGVLERLAERIAREVLVRKHAGCGSLLDAYPATIGAWPDTRLELGYAFLESAAFGRHRELPFSGRGTALEHAFFEFAEGVELGDPVLREREFLAAMIRLLLFSPRAEIELPAGIRRVEGGFFAVSERGEPALYAAVGGRFVHGALTPFLAELLAPGARADAVTARHGVSAPVLAQALATLSALGLVLCLE
jgi:hypothetical protein